MNLLKKLYAAAPEYILRALLLQVFFSIHY
jgi:hypothetical protein